MSLDFQVASLSYKSSSFATSRGNERYEGKNSESYTSGTISAFYLFGGCRHHLARWEACHMTQKANPVTLTLKIAAKPPPQPSARRAVKLKNPPAVRPVNPKNLHTAGVSKGGAAAIKNACHVFMAGIWIWCIILNGQNWDSSDNIWNVPFDFLIDIFALSNGSKYFYGNKKKGSDRDALQCQSLFWLDRNNT